MPAPASGPVAPLLLLLALLLGFATAQSCYYAANQLALDEYVPCNGGGGFSSCCLAGDWCLEDGACWSPTTLMTYIAGCTDSSYKDSTCMGASTCDKSTQFQGLARCGSNWVCCKGDGQTGEIPSKDYSTNCPCDEGFSTAIVGAGPLSAKVSLASTFPTTRPTSAPPTTTTKTTPSSAAATTSTKQSRTTTGATGENSSPTTTTTNNHPSSPAAATTLATVHTGPNNGVTGTGAAQSGSPSASSGSSNNALKIGLGVGIPLGLILVGLLVAGCWFWRKKHAEPEYRTQADLSTPVWQGESTVGSSSAAAFMSSPEPTAYHKATNPTQYAEKADGYPAMADMPSPPPVYHHPDSPNQWGTESSRR